VPEILLSAHHRASRGIKIPIFPISSSLQQASAACVSVSVLIIQKPCFLSEKIGPRAKVLPMRCFRFAHAPHEMQFDAENSAVQKKCEALHQKHCLPMEISAVAVKVLSYAVKMRFLIK
jgi:hypothetical protein